MNIDFQRRTTYLPAFVFLAATSLALAQATSSPTDGQLLRDAQRQLDEGRTTLDPVALSSARNSFNACIQADPRNARCYYGLAQVEHYQAQAEDFAHRPEAARHSVDEAIADAQRAVSLDDRGADAHALLADLFGQKITGAVSGMRYGPRANEESARALQLDPKNAQAFAVYGRKYLYSPSMFGGDVNKAIESFKRAAALDPQCDEDFVWLAIAYRKKGDAAGEQQALAQALRLNPRSAFARRVQSGAE